MQTKVCTKCGEEKEISEFYKLKYGKYGVESVCILCKKSPRARKKHLIPEGFNFCTECNKEKPLEDFGKTPDGFRGVTSKCKLCLKEKYKDRRKIYRIKYKEIAKDKTLKRDFGISLIQYNQMLEQQNGVCAICGQPEINKNRFGIIRLAVDHNHKTGKIRGLLCDKCNHFLGLAKENINILQNAINYLTRSNL